jgi:hypothetical protein
MRRLATMCASLLVLAAATVPPAHAQVNLAWNNCITQAPASANLDYSCNGTRNGTPFNLVPSFLSPANLTAFAGIQMYFDIYPSPSTPTLPNFWKLGTGECRDARVTSAIVFPASFTGMGTGSTGACQNPFAGATVTGDYAWNSALLPNRARLTLAITRDVARALTQGQQYLAGVIAIDTWGDAPNDAGFAVCSGCCQPMRIDLIKLELYQIPGTPPQDVYALFAPATRNYVTWQASFSCTPTVAPRPTWGLIKSLYR